MRLICLMLATLLAACSSTTPVTETYLLRSTPVDGSKTELMNSGIAMDNIQVAPYIDQPGLVLATGDGKVQSARHHLWAEPLQVSLRRFFTEEISAASKQDISAFPSASTLARIDVRIDQLHGESSGALLVAYWSISAGDDIQRHRFSQRQALTSGGYDALVAAEEALLSRLATAIAASLPVDHAVDSAGDG